MLQACYQELASLLPAPLESLNAAKCVERHRFDWRPPTVRTVLLAESHVFTSDDELVPMRGPHNLTSRPLNPTFARFVYCLGYGEPEFAGPHAPRSPGTPQFWKLFASCVHPPTSQAFSPLLKGTNPSLLERLKAKLSLLEQMRSLGVWLVDASAIALYAPGGSRPHDSDYERILKCSWYAYTRKIVSDARPHSIVVIGKSVARALEFELTHLPSIHIHCVSQPQGCRTVEKMNELHTTLHRVCQQAARAQGYVGGYAP